MTINEEKFKAICNFLKTSFFNSDKFIAEKQEFNYMWVGTADSEIGFILCHYEVLLWEKGEGEDKDAPYITVAVNIETENDDLRNKLAKICEDKKELKEIHSKNRYCKKYYRWFCNSMCKNIPLDQALANPKKIIKALTDLENLVGNALRKELEKILGDK